MSGSGANPGEDWNNIWQASGRGRG